MKRNTNEKYHMNI